MQKVRSTSTACAPSRFQRYQATLGNRGAGCLSRTQADITHFERLTFWEDTASIQRFAGDNYTRARYFDFDPDFLIEMEPTVRHYNLYTATTPDHPWVTVEAHA